VERLIVFRAGHAALFGGAVRSHNEALYACTHAIEAKRTDIVVPADLQAALDRTNEVLKRGYLNDWFRDHNVDQVRRDTQHIEASANCRLDPPVNGADNEAAGPFVSIRIDHAAELEQGQQAVLQFFQGAWTLRLRSRRVDDS